ncbi:MAG: hypothetical protein RMK99_07085 [Anaerolineales bacterium]|nr:hypothetical protein [Anaerolineales bacterium]
MKPAAMRRRLWLPVLLSLAALVMVAAYFLRRIGLGELNVFLGLFTIGFLLVESAGYVTSRFRQDYQCKEE